MKVKTILKVQNPQGLHARPATAIAKLLQSVQSSVSFSRGGERANAKSALAILTLAAAVGTEIDVVIEGDDAEQVEILLKTTFAERFGED